MTGLNLSTPPVYTDLNPFIESHAAMSSGVTKLTGLLETGWPIAFMTVATNTEHIETVSDDKLSLTGMLNAVVNRFAKL